MVHYLLIALALISLGLFWLKRKNILVSSQQEDWPTSEWSREKIENKLLLADPWEAATWLTAAFQTKDDLWPMLREVLRESGLEGIYIAAMTQDTEKSLLAIRALGLIGSEVSLPPLVKALGSKGDEISLAAMEAIKMLRIKACSNLLIDALITGQGAVPTRAASILIFLGSLVKESILEALDKVPDVYKAILIEVLGEMEQVNLLPELAPYLNAENSLLRQKAVQAIGTIGSVSACSYLIPLLQDGDWKVRAETAKYLGQLGCVEAVEQLKDLHDDPTWHVQVNAREALEELGITLEE
jgi:HEAT repeat protein